MQHTKKYVNIIFETFHARCKKRLQIHTFLENMFCSESPKVAVRVLINPAMSNDSSVKVAIATPTIIGTSDK